MNRPLGRLLLLLALPLAAAPPAAAQAPIEARITTVIDGDTIRVRPVESGRVTTVRLLGIDTPETRAPNRPGECGGAQATAGLRRLALHAGGGDRRAARLTTDPTQDRRDRYGRLLAYVDAGGQDLGAEQVRTGWAKVYVFRRPFEALARFEALQREARTARRGVWGACGGDWDRPAP